MASTNKTSYADLSQFIGTDVPQWLQDYNVDMQKIANNLESLNTKSESALDMITEIQDYFNLVNYKQFLVDELTLNGINGSITYLNLGLSTNNNKTLFKLYGQINISNPSGTDSIKTITIQSDLRPSENIIINAGVLLTEMKYSSGTYTNIWFNSKTFEILTDGTIKINLELVGLPTSLIIVLSPCLYFLKNFGDINIDVPITPELYTI